jgi:adenylate cyclase
MADIFVSYARSTAKQAQEIAEALCALGYNVWRDDELPAHKAYSEVIEEQLKSAKAVVVVWSAEAVKSHWVRAEADAAREAGTLVQLSIDGAIPPMPFNQIQCADMNRWSGEASAPGWRKVLASVTDLAGAAATAAAPAPVAQALAPVLPDKPSIAVLPFTDMTGSNDQDYFADGMVDEIVTALSRFSSLFVIANSSTLAYRGEARNLRQIAGELGVRYLLEGGVRKAGERVRISVKLADAIENLPIWSERFDGTLEDVFALQETVAKSVAGQIEPSIEASEIRRANAKPTGDLGAYDLYLRAIQLRRHIDKDSAAEALGFLERAIALDPDFALALALAAHIHARNYLFAWSDDPSRSSEMASQFANRALKLADNDPRVLSCAARAISNIGGDSTILEGLTRHALEINPNSADLWHYNALANLYSGRAELAMSQFETAMRLDPHSPDRPQIIAGFGGCLLLQSRFEEALSTYREALQLRPQFSIALAGLVVCLARLGRETEAKQALAALDPNALPRMLGLFGDAQTREFMRASMALVGVEI